MPKPDTNEAVAIASALRPTVDEWGRESSRPCVRMKKMTVASTYDTSTRTIGVREAFSATAQNIPCVPGMRGAAVGDPVWVQWLYGDKSTMCVVGPGNIGEYYEGAVNPNLIDNWYWIGGGSQQGGGQFPINQRGQTIYNGDSYTIDRWRVDSGITATIYSGYVQFANTTAVNDYVRNRLPINNNPPYHRTLTGTILYSDGTLDSGTIYVDVTGQTANLQPIRFFTRDWGFFLIEFPPSGNDFYQYQLTLYANSSVSISAIKVEYGIAQTLAYYDEANAIWKAREIPNYQEQLLRCLSYCCVLNANKVAYARYGQGIGNSTTNARIIIPFPARMWKPPTSVSYTGSIRLESGSANSAVSNITMDVACLDNATVNAVSTGLTNQRPYYLLDYSSGSSTITFSADL